MRCLNFKYAGCTMCVYVLHTYVCQNMCFLIVLEYEATFRSFIRTIFFIYFFLFYEFLRLSGIVIYR
jgi:hypothetical protein